MENGKFPNCQKLANITPVFQKTHEHQKIIMDSGQLLEFFDKIPMKFQCDFRKSYGTQYRLLLMLEIWKGATDDNKGFGDH